MAYNGSNWINNPWNESFKPFTDFFHDVTGIGGVFWIIPISVIALAIYSKTESPIIVSMYLIASGALFSAGNIFIGNSTMSIIYTVFTAFGITALIGSVLLQKR